MNGDIKKRWQLIIFIITITIIWSVFTALGGIIYIKICIKSEKPDEKYIRMKEINDKESLIGLSREEVKEVLGEPNMKYDFPKYKDVYRYDAGIKEKGLFVGNICVIFDCTDAYALNVGFDENDKVKSTSIQFVP